MKKPYLRSAAPPPRARRAACDLSTTCCLHWHFDRNPFGTTESYPLPPRLKPPCSLVRVCVVGAGNSRLVGLLVTFGRRPAADDRPRRGRGVPPGDRRTRRHRAAPAERAQAAVFDAATGSLAVLGPGPAGQSVITVLTRADAAQPVPLPGAATAMTGDNDGRLYASTRGGYFRVDLAVGDRREGGCRAGSRTPTSPRSPGARTASWCSAAPTEPSTR